MDNNNIGWIGYIFDLNSRDGYIFDSLTYGWIGYLHDWIGYICYD